MHGRMHICAAATGRGSAERSGAAPPRHLEAPSTVLESSVALEADPVAPHAQMPAQMIRCGAGP